MSIDHVCSEVPMIQSQLCWDTSSYNLPRLLQKYNATACLRCICKCKGEEGKFINIVRSKKEQNNTIVNSYEAIICKLFQKKKLPKAAC